MTSAPYLENFLDSLDFLPTDLQRNFNLMRELDNRAHKLLISIDEQANDLMTNIVADNLTAADKSSRVAEIQNGFNLANEYSEDKVQLATQSYELVDKYIRKLDINLSKFEKDIQEKLMNRSDAENAEEAESITNILKHISQRNNNSSAVFGNGKLGKSAGSKSKGKAKSTHIRNENPVNVSQHPDVLIQMAVDPNEPTYCLCSQVSYGEMIGCDHPDCLIEWFHFECVGLITKPKGKWFCPNCAKQK